MSDTDTAGLDPDLCREYATKLENELNKVVVAGNAARRIDLQGQLNLGAGPYGHLLQCNEDIKAVIKLLRNKAYEIELGDDAKQNQEVEWRWRGGECSYCDSDSIEFAHEYLRKLSRSELEKLYEEYRTMLPLVGEGSGSAGSDTHEIAKLLPRRTGKPGLPTLAWAQNAFEAITLVWAAAPKAGARLVAKPTPAPSAKQAMNGVKTAEVVGSGLKEDVWHRSAAWTIGEIRSKGTVFLIEGRDASVRTLVQVPGEMNGVVGRFEWIVDASGKLTHQMFVKGGSINGIPIKP